MVEREESLTIRIVEAADGFGFQRTEAQVGPTVGAVDEQQRPALRQLPPIGLVTVEFDVVFDVCEPNTTEPVAVMLGLPVFDDCLAQLLTGHLGHLEQEDLHRFVGQPAANAPLACGGSWPFALVLREGKGGGGHTAIHTGAIPL
ncbi:MAG: hypothetical protein WAW08_12920, partial [Candidatus Microthrix parvicella]